MLPLKPFTFFCLNLLLWSCLSAQWSPQPVISDFGGESLDSLFLSDSTFCKGAVLTISGTEFTSISIAEVFDSLSVMIGNQHCNVIYYDSVKIRADLPEILNDTCMDLVLTKHTHSIFGIHTYPVTDTVCLIGDVVDITYPDSVFCVGDINPQPLVILSPGTTGSFCCFNAVAGFLVLPDGTIPLHSGAVGTSNQFEFQSNHPFCPDTARVSVEIKLDTPGSFGWLGGDSAYCVGDPALADTALLFPPGGNFACHTPGLMISDDSLGVINTSASTPGTYQVWYRPSEPCFDSVAHLITILSPDSAGFIFDPSFYCLGDPDPLPLMTGDGGGLFSALSPATVIGTDGRLDLQASGPGNHTIQYTTLGACPDTASFTVVINNSLSAFFSYPTNNFCVNDSNPLPTVQALGGIFSGGIGLVIDSMSGAIDLSTSDPGIYSVSYSFSGSCQTSFSQTLTLNDIDTLTQMDYGAGPFCKDSLPVLPQVLGDSAGNFFAQGGLVFFSAANGAIDLSASPAGGPFVVTYDLLNPCAEDLTDTIFIDETPSINLFYPKADGCIGDAPLVPGALAAAGAFSFSPGLIGDPSGQIDMLNSLAGSHTVIYTSSGPCPVSVSTEIDIYPRPSAAGMLVEPAGGVCEGTPITATLSGVDAVSFSFLLNGETIDSTFFTHTIENPSDGDLLSGIVGNAFGCRDSFQTSLDLSPRPVISIDVPQEVRTGHLSEVSFSADLDSTLVRWWVRENNLAIDSGAIYQELSAEVSTIQVRTGRERTDPARVRVIAQPQKGSCPGDTVWDEFIVLPSEFFIPEVITPNGDGANDTWMISYPASIDPWDYELRLFNRAGGEVFSMQPLHQGFDGGDLPDGVYWWSLSTWEGKEVKQGGLTIRRK